MAKKLKGVIALFKVVCLYQDIQDEEEFLRYKDEYALPKFLKIPGIVKVTFSHCQKFHNALERDELSINYMAELYFANKQSFAYALETEYTKEIIQEFLKNSSNFTTLLLADEELHYPLFFERKAQCP